jgi:chromosome segregation ATPase
MKPLFVLVCFCLAARGQAPGSDAPALQALLAEVHQLRLALERSGSIAPRIQIAVERLKLQQDQVARTSRQLDDVRRQIEELQSARARLADRIQNLESEAPQTADPTERKRMNEELKSFRPEVEQFQKSEQQLRAREGELASQLQSEQARLTELNDRLDQMERALNVP